MQVNIQTIDSVLYKGNADKVVIPGLFGMFCILKNHANLSALVKEGDLVIHKGNEQQKIKITSGIAHFSNNELNINVQ